ncbi:MAG: MAPEG family protein [Alphaproteobacteria bacterium]|nr:MAPEG family protein [Alphaproteobacteria bacterium]
MEEVAAQITETVAQLSSGIIPISTLYIGLNALLNLILAILVVRVRVKTETQIGDGGNEDMIKAMRAHGNNVEYVPITLLVLIAVEMAAAPVWLVHALGAGLTVARAGHAFGISSSTGRSVGRFAGTMLGWIVLLVGSVACIYYGLN